MRNGTGSIGSLGVLALVLASGCGDNTPLDGATLADPTNTTATATGGGGGGGGGGGSGPGTGTGTGTGGSSVDSDGDGLSDTEEAALGSDPMVADTDGDGWDDGEEVSGYTDPLEASDHPYTGGWAMGACRHSITSTGNMVGQIADDFALMDQFGDTVRLHDFCDREVLLIGAAFW